MFSLNAGFGLDEARDLREPGVVDQAAERLEPERPLADVLVPIDPTAARPLRVVQVERAHRRKTDGPLELLHGSLVAAVGLEVVSGRVDVAGVDADADAPARRAGDLFPDGLQLLEPPAEAGPLPGGRLDEQPRLPGHACERARHRLPHEPVSFLLVVVAPRVEDERGDPEPLAAVQLVGERLPALLADLPIRRGAVDEVGRMGGHGLPGPSRLGSGTRSTSSASSGRAAQPRALRVKIWRQSAPSASARANAFETPPAMPSWAPSSMRAQSYTIAGPGPAMLGETGPSFREKPCTDSLLHAVRARGRACRSAGGAR